MKKTHMPIIYIKVLLWISIKHNDWRPVHHENIFKTIMKAKWPQSQGQEMDKKIFKSRFHASQVHDTPQKHEWYYLCCRNYTLKQFPTLFDP